MFQKLKQFKNLRNQAKSMQSALSVEQVTVEKHGVKLTLDGNQKILALKIDKDLNAERLEDILPDIFNEGIKKVQRKMAEVMQKQGGFKNLGL